MDVQGVRAAKPWYKKHKITYPALVDPANALGRVLGYKAVPNTFYVDETGVFHGRINKEQLIDNLAEPMRESAGDVRERVRRALPATALENIQAEAERKPEEFDVQMRAARAAVDVGRYGAAVACLRRATRLEPDAVQAWTMLATAYLGTDNKSEAAGALRKARELEPDNWLIRKQIWAIEHPEHFYEGPVDFAWQRQQLQREKESKK